MDYQLKKYSRRRCTLLSSWFHNTTGRVMPMTASCIFSSPLALEKRVRVLFHQPPLLFTDNRPETIHQPQSGGAPSSMAAPAAPASWWMKQGTVHQNGLGVQVMKGVFDLQIFQENADESSEVGDSIHQYGTVLFIR